MQETQLHPKLIRQILLLVVLFAIGILLFREMHFMFGGFLGAIALYTMLRRPLFYLVYKKKWPLALVVPLLLLLSLAFIVLPLAWVVGALIGEVKLLLVDTSRITDSVAAIEAYLNTRYNVDIFSIDYMQELPPLVASVGTKLLNATAATLTNLVVTYFLLWFMMMANSRMERWLRRSIPLKKDNTSKVLREVNEIVVGNTIGIPVLGMVQGIVAIIGYSMFGVEKPFFWGLVTGISSVVPFVGTMAAWVPLTLLTFAKGDTTNGYWLLFWGLIVIGGSDNVLRMFLQKYIADIHPIITVFGVIIGLSIFGFLGLIFGPLLISLFILLIRVYYDEFVGDYTANDDEKVT